MIQFFFRVCVCVCLRICAKNNMNSVKRKSVHAINFHEPGEWPRHCCSANDKARGVSPHTTSGHKKYIERVKPWFFRFSQLCFLQAVIGRAVAVSEQAVIVGDSVRAVLSRKEMSS